MNISTADVIGMVNIIVFQTPDGDIFFKVLDEDDDLFQVRDIIQDSLVKFKKC